MVLSCQFVAFLLEVLIVFSLALDNFEELKFL